MKPLARLLLIVVAAASFTAAAQTPRVREGFGSSYGPGLLIGSIDCDRCNEAGFAGLGGYLRLGRYLRPDLFFGVEASLHTLPMPYTRYDSNFLSAVVQWYPRVEKGLYVKGNLGVARLVEIDNEDDETRRRKLTAPVLGIGIGYDIRTRRRFLLTPFAHVTLAVGGDYRTDGQSAGSATATAIQVGMGFSWY